MRVCFISDTHGQHNEVKIPVCDLLIHAGDLTSRGAPLEVMNFISWFNHLDIKHKVFIAGNHDFALEKPDAVSWIDSKLKSNVHYLNDSGVEIEGLKIWGSPVQPWFHNWAFNRCRGSEIREHWKLIPEQTDILITHGPPYRILDRAVNGEYTGCRDLLDKVNEIKPRVHAFGHIHEGYGEVKIGDTKFINASVLNGLYELTNDPVVIEVA